MIAQVLTQRPSFLRVEPISSALKGRCIRAARVRKMQLVPWAIEMLALCCEASEEEARKAPPPKPVLCGVTDENGFACTLREGHEGDHVALGGRQNSIKARWPQHEEAV